MGVRTRPSRGRRGGTALPPTLSLHLSGLLSSCFSTWSPSWLGMGFSSSGKEGPSPASTSPSQDGSPWSEQAAPVLVPAWLGGVPVFAPTSLEVLHPHFQSHQAKSSRCSSSLIAVSPGGAAVFLRAGVGFFFICHRSTRQSLEWQGKEFPLP